MGAITQLRAGTDPETVNWNGQVRFVFAFWLDNFVEIGVELVYETMGSTWRCSCGDGE